MTKKNHKTPAGPTMGDYTVGLFSWLVPGLGYFLAGQRARGVIIFVTIVTTFTLGLLLGGIDLVDPHRARLWFCAQILTGLPAIIAVTLKNPDMAAGFGRGVDLGQLYTSVAGLLNFLCVLNCLLESSGGSSSSERPS